MLKTIVLLNIFVETEIYFRELFNEYILRTLLWIQLFLIWVNIIFILLLTSGVDIL